VLFRSMQAKLVRGPDGRLLFMEADSKVVDKLLAVLRAPLGSVLKDVIGNGVETNANGRVALGGLVDSASRLRPVLFDVPFDVPSEEVFPQKWDCTSRAPAEPAQCVLCVKYYGAQHDIRHSCTPTAKCGACGAIGTICDQHAQCKHCCAPYLKAMLDKHLHCVHCIVNGATGNLGQTSACTKCNEVKRVCSTCNKCDACGINASGYKITNFCPGSPDISSPDIMKAVCKETLTFLITNQLQVFENSFVKGLEIMGTSKVKGFDGLRYQNITVQPADLRSLFRHALCGSASVLDETFPSPSGAVDDDGQSSVHTTGSFNLVFDAPVS